jgi:hypothetical protein
MARTRNAAAHASMKVRGVKVFVVLLAGIALAALITQYTAIQERTRRFTGRAEPDELPQPPPPAPKQEPEPAHVTTRPETVITPMSEEVEIDDPVEQWLPQNGEHDCPEAFPIKGNATSKIYHLPTGASYSATIPNICFATEEAAQAAGFHAAKR